MNNRQAFSLTALFIFLSVVCAACSEEDTWSEDASNQNIPGDAKASPNGKDGAAIKDAGQATKSDAQPALDSGAGRDSAAGAQTGRDGAAADGRADQQAPAPEASTEAGASQAVTIHWWGQSCFTHSVEGGISVVNDPVPASYGFPAITVEAAVCTISHAHPDHNAVAAVPGSPEVIQTTGDHQAAGMTFTGVATFHDNNQGATRGSNIVFAWEMEGVHIVHLGDLGHVLSNEQVQQIGAVDVLMIPIGGSFTIDGPTAVQVAQQLSPKLIIPMHYNAGSAMTAFLGGVDPFLQAAVSTGWTVEQPDSASVTVRASDFTAQSTKIVVLKAM